MMMSGVDLDEMSEQQVDVLQNIESRFSQIIQTPGLSLSVEGNAVLQLRPPHLQIPVDELE